LQYENWRKLYKKIKASRHNINSSAPNVILSNVSPNHELNNNNDKTQ
jgi:hypothetical protein